jgi:hypothetical protein
MFTKMLNISKQYTKTLKRKGGKATVRNKKKKQRKGRKKKI